MVAGRPPERWRSSPWRPPFSGYPPPTGASHSRPTTNPTTSKAHEAVIDKDNLRTAPRSTSIWGSTTFIMRAVLTHLSIPLRTSNNISLRNDQEQIVFSATNSSAATSPAPVIHTTGTPQDTSHQQRPIVCARQQPGTGQGTPRHAPRPHWTARPQRLGTPCPPTSTRPNAT